MENEIKVMSTPYVTEDGILIDADVLARFPFKLYEPKVLECGNKVLPLNLYGG
jgi:hypothetical protein